MHRVSRRRAFTLIELLVVIGIIGILIGLTAAAVMHARRRAHIIECSNHLHQIGLALHQYHDAHRYFPPGSSFADGKSPYPHMSWMARLLPFIEQNDLWNTTLAAYAQVPHFGVNPPHIGFGTVLAVYTCPADSRTLSPMELDRGYTVAATAYLGVEGLDMFRRDGLLFMDSHTRISDITDGSSNTLLVGERPPSADHYLGWWYGGLGQWNSGSLDVVLGVKEIKKFGPMMLADQCPYGVYEFKEGRPDEQCDAYHFWSLHDGGANFLFADGAVRFIRYDAAPLMPALASRSGGEVAELPD